MYCLSSQLDSTLKPPIALGRDGDEPDKIYKAYLAAREQLKEEKASISNTLGWIVDEYMKSRQYINLSASTQKRTKNLKKILEQPIKINGNNDTLTNLYIKDVNKPLFQALAEKRLRDYQAAGRKGNVQVNREITFISSAIKWATNYVHDLGIIENPLKGFSKIKEIPVS